MKQNEYGEIINDEYNYRIIASNLMKGNTVGIGWSDEESTHLDIIFKLGITKHGYFQRGLQEDYLYVSIIDHNSYGFRTDIVDKKNYIQEKLRIKGDCGDRLAQLINGIILFINIGDIFYE